MSVLKATVECRYKDRDGTWKSSGSFSRNEVPLVIYCLSKAFAAMIEEKTGHNEEPTNEEPTVEEETVE